MPVKKKPVVKAAEAAVKRVSKRAGKAKDKAQATSLDAAQRLVRAQQKAFDATLKAIARLQDQSEKAVRKAVGKAEWMPKEGKALVDEWINAVHGGRTGFQETVEKSFGLVGEFLTRAQTEAKTKAQQTAPAPAAKNPVAKKPAAKAKAAKKPAAKKSAAKA
jgi:hypothetical protein